ncbi:MAG TPA: GNAT family N-acetyltransferase [Vicinamibacterales bacterium]|jgi:aminoglycoside 6'-N-acetyltransferase I
MLIRPVTRSDGVEWARLRECLWPSGDHAAEIARFFDGVVLPTLGAAFVGMDDSGRPVGFAEASIRPYAEGCHSGRVAYLEGLFVEPHARRRGIGRALVAAVEAWGRAQRCTELGSDTDIANDVSASAHRALGFDEVERQICFRKPL